MILTIIKPFVRLGLKILSFVLFVLTLVAAYGGRVNPEFFFVPSVFTLALPYFAIATALVSVGWFCSGRWFTAGLGVATLLVAWGPVSTTFPLKFPRSPADESRTFTLLTYNTVHGWDQEHPDDPGSQRTFRYILDSGADLVGLQETINLDDPREIPSLEGGLRDSLYKAYPYRAGTKGTDIKVLSKYPVKLIDEYYTNPVYEVTMPWGKLHWINMHMTSFNLSNEERKVMREVISVKDTEAGLREMKGSLKDKLKAGFVARAKRVSDLREVIESIPGPLIVSGDLNDVPESYAYRLLRGTDLCDAYTETSFGPLITYNRYGFWFHLDQILYRPNPLKALKVEKGRLRSSDHYPLKVEFEWL
ncbi:MAG: endonuclease/exonuclease/phosphatase family protein [Muribaculaceae bacterium]|nr:endonuclease/exonuclease/phosphatase family protein [Muribaculaceae bacterium]